MIPENSYENPPSSPTSPPDAVLAPITMHTLAAINSSDLFQDKKEVLIQHCGETYRLRITKNNKLILHK